jgi:hypothetical protein
METLRDGLSPNGRSYDLSENIIFFCILIPSKHRPCQAGLAPRMAFRIKGLVGWRCAPPQPQAGPEVHFFYAPRLRGIPEIPCNSTACTDEREYSFSIHPAGIRACSSHGIMGPIPHVLALLVIAGWARGTPGARSCPVQRAQCRACTMHVPRHHGPARPRNPRLACTRPWIPGRARDDSPFFVIAGLTRNP